MNIASRIKTARTLQSMSQDQLGRKLNISSATVGGWERGEFLPTPKQLKPLCEALNLDHEAFVQALIRDRDLKAARRDAKRLVRSTSNLSQE